jgi:nitroimidazol reductase NimA-like FMN-containing flavoprotein (pyridoxamine 5'-phosphate oxidase superfamily)
MHERGAYDRATIDAVLDAQPLAHVAWTLDGLPRVTPTLQWREGDRVYWHGSAASPMLEHGADAEVCLAVTLMDGFVLARSAFNHSVNYRSVVLFGRARPVTDPAEKTARLRAMMEHLFPGRWDTLRALTAQEIRATAMLSLPIDEASAKARSGLPGDDEEDLALPIWAGVVPLRVETLPPVADPRSPPGLEVPAHARSVRVGGTPG